MIGIVIIEDEAPARRKLRRFLDQLNEPVKVLAELETVKQAISFLSTAGSVDLILSDIELLDGNAFEIYSQVALSSPVIFTTAYNQFLMDAFESNGIEYLLKPFSFERFKKAWHKFLLLKGVKPKQDELLYKISLFLEKQRPANEAFKKRFSISCNRHTYFVDADQVLFFTAEEGIVMAIDLQGKRHPLSQATLKEIEQVVDPSCFFRINRSELVHKKYIERMERFTKNTISMKLKGHDRQLQTSQSTTALFREWIER